MNKTIKRILKVIGCLLGVVVIGVGVFVAFNFTLLKNLPSSQDGGSDAMYIANQNPLQLVKGQPQDALSVSQDAGVSFEAAHENWEQTGGKALLIWHKGNLLYETYADGVSPSDRSKSFSMHKSVLGLVAATMEADGLIDLDDPVSKYVDAYKKGGKANLTVRNMLQHEARLERYSFTPPSFDTLNLLLSHKVEKTALKAKLLSDELSFDYSNISSQVAGAALRRALAQQTSQTYAEYLSSRLWTPLGGNDAYLWAETPDGAPRFYAGLQATPRDWLKIGVMIAQNDGSILPKSAIATVLTPAQTNPGYGLGVWLGSPEDGTREYGPSTAMAVPSALPFALPDTVFFDGFGGQRVYISQKEQLVIVRIGDVRFDWDDTAIPNLVAGALNIEPSYVDDTLTLKGKGERKIDVRMVSRNAACTGCKFAVLSHGTFAGAGDYDAIVKPLADLGYRVAIPVHPDSRSHPQHSSLDPKRYLEYRMEDHQLILEHIASAYGSDTKWVSVGHSFGALISGTFAGATLDPDFLKTSDLGLPTHSVLLSPPNGVPVVFPLESFPNLKSPTLLVTGTADLVPTMIDDWEEHLDLYHAGPKDKVTAVVFDDHDHYFNGLYGRVIDREKSQADADLIELMNAFLRDEALPGEAPGYRVLP